MYNPDGTPKQKRWYDSNGNAKRDRDYNHAGKDIPFPHDHEWNNGKRQKEHIPTSPEYEISWEPVVGIGITFACAIGIVIVSADDFTGIGVADNFLLAPLWTGFANGIAMIA